MVLVKGGRGYHVLDLAGGQNWREERLVRGKGIIGWLDRSIFTVMYSLKSGFGYEQYPCAKI